MVADWLARSCRGALTSEISVLSTDAGVLELDETWSLLSAALSWESLDDFAGLDWDPASCLPGLLFSCMMQGVPLS